MYHIQIIESYFDEALQCHQQSQLVDINVIMIRYKSISCIGEEDYEISIAPHPAKYELVKDSYPAKIFLFYNTANLIRRNIIS